MTGRVPSPARVRPWASTVVFVLAVLAMVALRRDEPRTVAVLAALAGIAIAFRLTVGLAPTTAVLGPHAGALDLVAGTALTLAAAAVTGGGRSPLAALVAVDIVLARRLEGPFAARFQSVAAVGGLAVLAVVTPAGLPAWAQGLLVVWPLALLGALETGAPAAPREATAAARVEDSRAGLLHDLRSPLSVIRVYADLLQERARQGAPVSAEHLANLAAEVDLMERMIGRPPSAGPARAGAAGALDLVRVASDLAGRYRAAHGDRVVVETIAEKPRVLVRADEVAVQRVLRNVLENAVQYTAPGGTISVRVTADDTHGEVAITDDGVGMSVEDRARAFDPAYRGRAGRAVRDGSGLGLAVSRELVESMGGRISLRSEEDRGSEVRIVLPLAGTA